MLRIAADKAVVPIAAGRPCFCPEGGRSGRRCKADCPSPERKQNQLVGEPALRFSTPNRRQEGQNLTERIVKLSVQEDEAEDVSYRYLVITNPCGFCNSYKNMGVPANAAFTVAFCPKQTRLG